MFLSKGDIIVFQGDSVTDCDRLSEPTRLGYGYARTVGEYFCGMYPDFELTFYNSGISGNRSIDLVKRWQTDTLDFKPTVVSVLIGINDVGRNFDSNDLTTCEAYAANIEDIFSRTKAAGAKLLVLEPFVQGKHEWYADLGGKINALRIVAEKYADGYIPLDGLFQKLTLERPLSEITHDGVHPTVEGHREIAERIIEFFER